MICLHFSVSLSNSRMSFILNNFMWHCVNPKISEHFYYLKSIFFQSLQEDLQEHQGSLDYINKTGKELVVKSGPHDKAQAMERNLEGLNSRWSHVSREINSRLAKLERAIGQIKQYQVSSTFITFILRSIFNKKNFMKKNWNFFFVNWYVSLKNFNLDRKVLKCR